MNYPEARHRPAGDGHMQDDSARLFTALWPEPALRARLSEARDGWRWPPGAKPAADANLHLTLHFVGAFPRARIAALDSALAMLPIVPTTLHALAAELWRGGIAVLRFAAADPALAELHAGIGTVLCGLGVALDPRPFAPHVTLARRARGAMPPAAAARLDWRVGGFALVESLAGPRPSYRVLRSYGEDARDP
jgi:2'-5' RNA ligase